MKHLLGIVLCALMLLCFSFPTYAAAKKKEAFPIQVSTGRNGKDQRIIQVVSIVDSVKIVGLTVNRGNCVIRDQFGNIVGGERRGPFPVTLKFGEGYDFISTKADSYNQCEHFVEIIVKTDHGDITVNRK